MKGLLVAALLAALAGGGYFGWTKYDEGVKAREAQQAEERARLEKSAEEHIARLKAEKDKVEAEKRKIEAEREKQMNEEAKRKKEVERERNEKDRKIKALSVAEDEVEVCKNRINSILRGDFRAQGGLKDDWQGFDAGMITMIDATVSVVEEPHWKRIAQDLSADNHVDTIDDASAIVQKELKRLKKRLKEITRVKRVYDAKELESRKKRCRSCGGSKRVTCLRCNGKGMVRVAGEDCSACDGKGLVSEPRPCDACGGSGVSSVKRRCSYCQGKKLRCSSCRGRGFYDITGSLRRPRCGACNGRGYYSCDSCGGSGSEVETVTCKKCSGSGTLDVSMRCSRCAGTGKEQREQSCPSCDGIGKSTCESCDGRGFIYRPKGETKSPPRKKDGDGEKKVLVH